MKFVKLGDKDYFRITIGQSPVSSSYNKVGKGLPFYQGKSDFGQMFPNPRVWCDMPKRTADCGDILMSIRAPVGPVNIANNECCIGRGLVAIKTTDKVLSQYVYWMLKAQESNIAKEGNGSMFNSITKDQIRDISIPIFNSLTKQRQITKIIEQQIAISEGIVGHVNVQNKAIESFSSSLLHEAFPWDENKRLPTGWKWTPISSLMETSRQNIAHKKVNTSEYSTYGRYPIIDQSRHFIAGYTDDATKVIHVPSPVIVFGDHTRCVKLIDFDFVQGADGVKVIQPNDKHVVPKYLYYYLKGVEIPNDGYGRHYKYVKSLSVPIPSRIETQQEIVSQLDKQFSVIQRIIEEANIQKHAIKTLSFAIVSNLYHIILEKK